MSPFVNSKPCAKILAQGLNTRLRKVGIND